MTIAFVDAVDQFSKADLPPNGTNCELTWSSYCKFDLLPTLQFGSFGSTNRYSHS